MKRFLHFLLFLLLSLGFSGVSNAQNVFINSSVPTELTVCGGSEAFTIEVINDFNTTLTGISVNIVFPQGISYEVGSVIETTTNNSYGVTESNISNLSSIDLTIGNLPGNSTVSLTFNAVATFDAIASQNAGNIFRNSATVNYIGGNITEQSDAYNILFAALSITQVTPLTKNVFVGEAYARQVKIVNSGSGRINSLLLNDIHDTTKVKTIGTDKGTLSTDGSKITLTSADFMSIGNGDGWLDLNESIIITETIYAIGCVDAQSQLYATWGCDGQTLASNNKFPFTDMSLYAPDIVASAVPSFNTYLNVNTANQQQILLINTGSGPANTLEVEAYQTTGNGYDLDIFSRIDENSVQYKIGINGILTAITPTLAVATTNTGAFSCLGINPIGKVVLDLPILQPGDSMYIVWDSYTCDNITVCESIDLIGWDYKVSYTDMCAQESYVQNNKQGQKPQKKGFSVFAEYPTDLADGQVGEFNFRLTGASFEMPLTGNNPYFVAKFTIPAGLAWSGNNSDLEFVGGNTTWNPSSVTYTNGILEAQYSFPEPFDLLNSEFKLALTGDCATGSNGLLAVDMQLFLGMDGSSTGGQTTSYVLTDSSGQILAIANSPNFMGLTTTNYASYAVTYETTSGITGLVIGQNIQNVSSSGYLVVSDPYNFKICPVSLPTPPTACSYVAVTDITLSQSGGSNAAGETTRYVLTDMSGQILAVENTPNFVGLTHTDYGGYAVSYETASGINGLAIGQNIQTVSSSGCLDFSAPYSFRICPAGLPATPTTCNYTGVTNITLSESGGSNAAGETTSYVLTDLSGQILAIENTPTFTGLTIGNYGSYAISYETASGITGLTIGQNVLDVSSSGCFNSSTPYSFGICPLGLPAAPTTCNYTSVTSITLSQSGGSNAAGETTSYILTDLSGEILAIENTPTFTGLIAADYGSYALSYETTSGVTGLTIGQNIQNVTSSGCFNFSSSYSFRICSSLPSTPTTCNYTGVTSITLSQSGGSNAAGETTSYILTDLSGEILAIENTPTFTGLTTTDYGSYAVSYGTTSGVTGLTVGQNVLDISSSGCLDVSSPHSFRICPMSCNYTGTTTVTLTKTGGSNAAGETTRYVLANTSGQILDIQTNPTFNNLTNTDYQAYAVSYETASGVTDLIIGQNIQNVTSSGCLDISNPHSFRICPVDLPTAPTDCNYTGTTNISLPQTGGSFFPAYEVSVTCPTLVSTQLHCLDESCVGMAFDGFAVERTSFGLADNDKDGVPDATGSLDMNVIELDRMMVSDTFKTTFTGIVNTDATNLNWQYGYASTKMPSGNEIDIIGASITVIDQSTGQTLTCDNIPFTSVMSGTNRDVNFDYSVATLTGLGCSDFNGFVYEDGDQVILNGIYKVIGNIGATTSQILITENEFYLSDIQNPTLSNDKYSCDDWNGGFTLIGYDLTNYDENSITLDSNEKTISQFYKLQVGSGDVFNDLFPSEYRNWGYLKQVNLELPAGYSITGGHFYQYSTTYSNVSRNDSTSNLQPISVTPNGSGGSIYTYDLEQYYELNGGNINVSDDGFYGQFRADIRAICTIPQETYEAINWTFEYNNNAFIGGGTSGAIASSTPDYIRYRRGEMELFSTQQTVDGIGNAVTWVVQVKPTGTAAENAFLTFGSTAINVFEVRDAISNVLITENNGLYELGNINENQTKSYKITATYSSCNLHQLNIFAGYDADAYPASLGTSCGFQTYPLYVDAQPSALQVSIVDLTPADPCGPRVTVEVDMLSSEFASVQNLFINIKVPSNNSLELEADSTAVQYPFGSNYTAITNPVLIGDTIYQITAMDMDSILGADGLEGITNTSANRIKVRFNLYMNSNFESGSLAEITVGGYSACGLELPSVSLAYDPNTVFAKADNTLVGLDDQEDSWSTAFGDYDNDGWVDLFLVNYKIDGLNQLYHNDGDGTFTKVTSGNPIVTDIAPSTSAVWGDYDNDGDLDLYVSNNIGFKNFLYRNEGGGNFTSILNDPIVNYTGYAHGAAWADYDNDGYIDMFVSDYFSTRFNKLYHNNGDGTFAAVTSSPIVTDAAFSISGAWGDYDNDGDQDLFVPNTNDENNFLYINEGNGQFTKITTGDIVNDGGKSVGASWGDYDNDLDLDLFVSNAGNQNNFLYRNDGDGTFTKITNSVVTMNGGNSHGSAWGDYDSDGDIDLLVSNDAGGNNFLYANNGDGTFVAISNIITQDGGKSFGAAWADVDNDLDLDLHIANYGDEGNFLYLNERGECAAKACFTFIGTNTNTSAFGSKIKVLATIDGVQRWQMRELASLSGGGIGGQNELKTLIGLSDAAQIDSLIIEWASGVVQKFGAMATDTCWTITEQDGSKVCGTVYEDVNGNCQQDVDENGIPNISVTVQPGNRQVSTDENGEYAFNLAPGTYTVSQIDNAAWKQSCGSAPKIVNVLGIGNEYCGNDFADTTACQSPDLYVQLATTALRVGFENLYAITFGNNGTEAAISTVLKVDLGQYIIPLSSSLPWDSKVGTELTWDIGGLEIGQQFTIYVADSVSTAVTIGNNITVTGTIVDNSNVNSDCNGADNTTIDINEAVGAIDPNDIQVSPEGYISVDQELKYKIRFQNVGNDLVNRVVLRDELPEGLDISTLVRGVASHPYQFRIEGERTLVWEFDNINLPDSTSNELESHGFATFKITPQSDLADGVELPNKAGIYFDNSAVVITNTVINIIGEPTSVKPGNMTIFPNPMSHYTTISIVPRQVNSNEEEIQNIEIFTPLGVKVLSLNSLTGIRVTIEIDGLAAGYYIVKVKSNKGIIYIGRLLVSNL